MIFSPPQKKKKCSHRLTQVDSETLRKVWSDPMNGAVHCLVSNQGGTMVGIGHGTELSIIQAKTICTCRYLRSIVRPADEPFAATWSTVQRLPDPPPLPGLEETEGLPSPLVRSLHFIDGGKMLIAAYLDHGFVSVASLIPCSTVLTFIQQPQLLEFEFVGGSVAFGSTHLLHVSPRLPCIRRC